MMDETKPRAERNETSPVVNEYSDLLVLYDTEKPPKERVKEVLEQHHKKFGSMGFNHDWDEEVVDAIHKHFNENSQEYLEAELNFIHELELQDLETLANQGFERARSVFVENQIFETHPQAVLLFNGRKIDAKLFGGKQENRFGVNINRLFREIYDDKSNSYDVNTALEMLYSTSAHEGNHVYTKQTRKNENEKYDWIVQKCYLEGLATFVETQHYPWHYEYLEEIDFWKDIVSRVLSSRSNEKRIQILRDMENNELLNKFNEDAISKIRLVTKSEGDFDRDKYEDALNWALSKRNGPIYHVGYSIINSLYQESGIQGIRELTSEGIGSFKKLILEPRL